MSDDVCMLGCLGSERSEAPSEARVRLDLCDNSLRITALVLGALVGRPQPRRRGAHSPQPRSPPFVMRACRGGYPLDVNHQGIQIVRQKSRHKLGTRRSQSLAEAHQP